MPLDGISLAPLLAGQMQARQKPMGFWDYQIAGVTPKSTELLETLAREQAADRIRPDDETEPIPIVQLRSDYSTAAFPAHAAWLDGDWKLHRIEGRQAPLNGNSTTSPVTASKLPT